MTELLFIFNDVKLEETNDLQLLRYNRGFLYGDGFFETLIYDKHTFNFNKYHQRRIQQSLALLQMEESAGTDLDWIAQQLSIRLAKDKRYRVRLSIYRHSNGQYAPGGSESNTVISIKEGNDSYSVRETGMHISIYHDQQKASGKYSKIKSLSSSFYVQAAIYNQHIKTHDCLLLNTNDEIMESINSNVFIVVNDRIITPPIESGCIDGIFRKFMLDQSKKIGYKIYEERILKSDVLSANECWLSNAVQGLRWVDDFKGKKFGNELYKEFYSQLIQLIQ